jgi:hypothetical protein
MKNKICGIFVFALLITISVCALSVSANQESDLKVGVFGASMFGLRQAGGIIWNDGDETIKDVQYTFTVKGGSDDSINIKESGVAIDGNIEVNQAYSISTSEARGFGPVTLTMTVTSSNAGEVTASSKGFQIGSYTISKTYFMAWFYTLLPEK